MQSCPLKIIPFGAPSSGKSTVLNGLAGRPGYFTQNQEIKCFEGPAFGISSNLQLTLYNTPGIDFKVPTSEIITDITASIGGNNIDASLFVIKATDYRIDL